MKTRIFKSTKGWYIYATNYKDKDDKAYMGLFFPQNSEPTTNGDYLDIDIEEARFTSFKGKIGLTIFKYSNSDLNQEDSKGLGSKFDIKPDELPFY